MNLPKVYSKPDDFPDTATASQKFFALNWCFNELNYDDYPTILSLPLEGQKLAILFEINYMLVNNPFTNVVERFHQLKDALLEVLHDIELPLFVEACNKVFKTVYGETDGHLLSNDEYSAAWRAFEGVIDLKEMSETQLALIKHFSHLSSFCDLDSWDPYTDVDEELKLKYKDSIDDVFFVHASKYVESYFDKQGFTFSD